MKMTHRLNNPRKQKRNRKRAAGPRRLTTAEILEARHLLATDILGLHPSGTVSEAVREVEIDFSAPLLGDSARDADNYALTYFGGDGIAGGGDDVSISVLPQYLDDTDVLRLSTLADLSSWSEVDYAFPPGIFGEWSISDDGASVLQTANGGSTFFVSDDAYIDRPLAAQLEVTADTDDDYIGVVFGMTVNEETQYPDSYYLLSWKRSSAGSAQAGLKLARVTGTAEMAERPDLWSLSSADRHIQILDSAPGTAWSPGTRYSIRVEQSSDGSIELAVANASTGAAVYGFNGVDPTPLGAGRFGFYNFSQANVQHWALNTTGALPTGTYELRVRGGVGGLLDAAGELVDGDSDGLAGGDYVSTFTVDIGVPTISIDMQTGSDTGVSASDELTNDNTPTFDIETNRSGVVTILSGVDESVIDTIVFTDGGSTEWTAPALPDGSTTVRARFVPDLGNPVEATIDVVVDTVAPALVSGLSEAQAPLYSRSIAFTEAIDASTLSITLEGPAGLVSGVAVDGSDDSYLLSFSPQVVAGGYVASAAAGVVDRAGNAIDPTRRTDSFTLVADSSGPAVTGFARSGIVKASVSRFTVAFDEEVLPDTFTEADVELSGPEGTSLPTIGSVNAIDAGNREFEILLESPLAFDGDFSVTIGPEVSDLSGNDLSEAFVGEFSIQLPLPIPAAPGDGVFIELYNGIGGGRAPLPSDISERTPDGTTLSPEIDFPRPGNVINVGQSFTTFFSSTATPPDEVAGLAARNFILDHQFFVAISDEMDLDPLTPEIDVRFGVGSDDGFHLTIDDRLLGSAGDRAFAFSWFDFSVESAGLFPVSLLFAANAVGFSGLEFWWNTAESGGNQLVPQQYLYVTPILGEQTISFEELAVGTAISDQFRDKGILFETVGGDPRVTNAFPGDFVPVSPSNVFADPADTPADVGEVDLTFVVPDTDDAATTNFISFYLIDTEEIGATVTAFDPEGQVVYFETVSEGGASQKQVTIQRDRIARVNVTLGQGTDTAAIDNITFNTPETLNSRPTIDAIADATIAEGERLSFTVQASDPDLPDQQLTYLLGPGAASNVSLNSTTGAFSWTPSELQGPGVYPITVIVRDNGSPRLRVEESFVVTVTESNQAPTLGGIADTTLTLEDPTIEFFAPGADDDRPVQSLTYRLLPGAPSWASIREGDGFFSATIDGSVSDGAYPITVEVQDDGEGGLTATRTFEITVDNNRPNLIVNGIGTALSTIDPGAEFTLDWLIANSGSEPAAGPWTERVYVASDAAGSNRRLLAEFEYAGGLSPSDDPIARSEPITVPITSLNGDVYFLVEVDATDNVVESDEHNLFASDATYNVAAALELTVATIAVTEGGPAARATLTRNGDVSEPLEVTLSPSIADQLDLPSTVTIPAGQYTRRFDIRALDDEEFDGDLEVAVTATAAGYPAALIVLTAVDNDDPTLTLSVPAEQVEEGGVLTATVERSIAAANDIVINIASSDDDQLDVPLAVVLSAGETMVTFDLRAVDDTFVERLATYVVSVNAAGHIGDSAIVDIPQNDLPVLGLTVPGMLSEGSSGPTVLGTITRDVVTDRDLVVELTTTDASLISVPSAVTILAGQRTATFPIDVADDGDVNEDRSVDVTARVLPTAGGLPFDEGAATDTLQVLDNDGLMLTLTLQRDTLAEGRTINATVRRNTEDVSTPLVVTLTPEDIGELAAPATVEIPVGSQTVEFVLAGVEDDETDGDQVVAITASAEGFNTGTGTVVVVDINLPDIVPTQLEPEKLTALTGETIDVNWMIENLGFATAEGTWTQRVFISSDNRVGNDTLAGQYTFTGPLGEGQGYDRSAPIRMPTEPGNYWIVVQTDVANTVLEGLETNNTRVSAAPITVSPSYVATVMTDVEMAPADTPVLLTGFATNVADETPAAFREVSVHLQVRGTKRVFTAITDANGEFELTFNPLPGEGGSYTVGAAFPGVANAAIQDSFKLVGMRAEPPRDSIRVTEAAGPRGDSITLRNLADVPLTGLSIEVLGDIPSNILISAELAGDATELSEMGTLAVNYTVEATDPSVLSGRFSLRVTSNEAPDVVVPIDYSVTPLRASLVVNPGRLSLSAVIGQERFYEFDVTNTGGKESGNVEVFIPDVDWFRVASPKTIPSLQPGESSTVTLRLAAPDSLVPQRFTGQLELFAPNALVRVPTTVNVVSETTTTLSVLVEDEYTYFAEDTPPLAGATVSIRDAVTGSSFPSRTTTASGAVDFEGIPEGVYDVSVSAPRHNSYRNTVRISAGQENNIRAFLPRETVSYNWTVTPTEVEDRTRITLETTFETNVPAPVITVSPGVIYFDDLTFHDNEAQVIFTITNHGLIATDDARLVLPEHPLYEFVPLVDDVGVLPAKTTLNIPVTVRRLFAIGSIASAGSQHTTVDEASHATSVIAAAISEAPAGPPLGPSDGSAGRSGSAEFDATVNIKGMQIQLGKIVAEVRELADGIGGNRTVTMSADFFPNEDAPQLSGECELRWIQIARPGRNAKTPPWDHDNDPSTPDLETPFGPDAPIIDPPRGGWGYQRTNPSTSGGDDSPFYWNDPSTGNPEYQAGAHPGAPGSTNHIEDMPNNVRDSQLFETYLVLTGPCIAEASEKENAAIILTGFEWKRLLDAFELPIVQGRGPSPASPNLGEIEEALNRGGFDDWEILGPDSIDVACCLLPDVKPDVFTICEGETLSGNLVDDNGFGEDILVCPEIEVISSPASGELTWSPDGSFTYQPMPGFSGYDSFIYKSSNGHDGFDTAEATIVVEPCHLVGYQESTYVCEVPITQRNPITFIICPEGCRSVPAQVNGGSSAPRSGGPAAGGGVSWTPTSYVTTPNQCDIHSPSQIVASGVGETFLTAAAQEATSGVCAQVRLQIDQEAVQVRDAFDARLEITNFTEGSLTDIGVEILVTNRAGDDVTDLFGFLPPELAGLSGVDGSGILGATSTGTASWVIIPATDAASDGVTEYFVSGTLSYVEEGLLVTAPLAEVSIMVYPQAELDLDYFLQRDVLSDDPFTDEVESAEPFTLAVQVQNNGGGAARNLRIESAQPRIIENEKGLLIDFEITGTKVNGGEVKPSLTANFGNVESGQVAVAEWQMESTLQGLFVDYSATFEHISPFGDNRFSLIKSVDIHELIRVADGTQADGGDGLPDFLVNDIEDPADLPDTLYISNGDVVDVTPVVDADTDWGEVALGMMRLDIAPTLSTEGWSYLKINDPSEGDFELIAVERSDGTILPLENFWQTDRTFVGGGQRPVLEDKVHLLDFESTGEYTLVFSNGDRTGPEVTGFAGVTPNPTTETIDVIDVVFDERLADATFDEADLTLIKNGEPVALSGLTVAFVSGTTYRISGLAPFTSDDAVYELRVNTETLTDQVGNSGVEMQSFRWVKGEAAPTILALEGAPNGLVTSGVTSIDIVFSKPIDLATLTADDLSLSRDGVELIDNQVTISQVGASSYRVTGLGGLTNVDGDYSFSIDATGVVDLVGNPGLGEASASWTLDTTAPELLDVIDPATTPRNIVVQQIDVEFSEPIDLSTLDVGDLSLVRDGGSENLLAGDERVTFQARGGNRYRILGINWVQAFVGDPQVANFTLTVDGGGVADLAGNFGAGVLSSTWTIDLDSPDAPTNLALSTFSGAVTDGMVNSRNAVVSGDLSEPGLTVVVEDATTETELARVVASEPSFSLPIDFPSFGQHQLRITLVDSAGNTTEATIDDLFVKDTPPVVESIVGVPGEFSRGGIDGVTVTFVDPIDPATLTKAALTLTRNGGTNLVNGTVSIAPLGDGRTYRFEGLAPITADEGRYNLSFNFGGVANEMGLRSTEIEDFSWRNDLTAPTSGIDTLEFRQELGSFVIDLSGDDAALASNIDGSGVVEFDLYFSDNGSPFQLLETLPADSPTTTFVGEPNRLYYFRSVARDAAGNEERKPFRVDAWTYVPDLFAPVTQVDSVDTTDATFEVAFSGRDRGMGIEAFDLYVQVDGGPVQAVASAPAGEADSTGLYTGTLAYQAISDGESHDYRFFTIARDFDGNWEPEPESPADFVVQASYDSPATTEVVDFDIQNGADQRSYIRYIDMVLNSGDQLADILASISDGSADNDRIRLTRYGIDGSGQGEAVGLTGSVNAVDQALLLDFGEQGLGGNRNSSLGDGYYQVELDLDGDGSLETQLGFFRLLGDADGDGDVDNADLASVNSAFGQLGSNLNSDLNGDGRVNIFDRQLWLRGRGRMIGDGLQIDD